MNPIRIPNWLKARKIGPNDLQDLQNLFPQGAGYCFQDIEWSVLHDFRQTSSGTAFYRLIRLLGWYGVQFDGRLASYSSEACDNPDVLRIPLSDFNIPLQTLPSKARAMGESLGLKYLGQMHGVPLENILPFFHQGTSENVALLFKAEATPVGEHFFSSSALSKTKSLALEQTEVDEALKTPIYDLNLSLRNRNFLKEQQVEWVWQVAQFSLEELMTFRNLGQKSIEELQRALKALGLSWGMVFSPEQLESLNRSPARGANEVDSNWLCHVAHELNRHSLDFLGEQQGKILKERTWAEGKKRTLASLAEELRITRERVRQLEKESLERVREKYASTLPKATSALWRALEDSKGKLELIQISEQWQELKEAEQRIVETLVSDGSLEWDWSKGLLLHKA